MGERLAEKKTQADFELERPILEQYALSTFRGDPPHSWEDLDRADGKCRPDPEC